MSTESEIRAEGKALPVDNGGKPYTVSTGYVDCKSYSFDAYTQAQEQLQLDRDPIDGQAPWSRGHVLVAGDVASFSNADGLYLEVNVIGVVGGVSDILARCSLSQSRPNAHVDVRRPYERIVFEARRQILPGDSPLQSQGCGFSAVGRFWR